MDLDLKHPLWVRRHKRWIMAQDFLRSGQDVMEPEEFRESLSFSIKKDDFDSDLEMSSTESGFSWYDTQENSYIFTHEREKFRHWKTRQARAIHFPIMMSILGIFQQGVTKAEPLRGGKLGIDGLPKRYADFVNDSGGDGLSFDLLRDETSSIGAACGLCYTMFEYEPPKDEPVSEAHRLALGNRAYAHLVNPVALINWSEDSRGRLRWAIIAESGEDTSDWREPECLVEQRRVLTPEKIYIYRRNADPRSADGPWKLHQSYDNKFGVVPLVAWRNNLRKNSRGYRTSDPFIPSLVDADRSIYNKMSLLDQIDNNQTFSILAIPRQGALSGLDLSVFEAIAFDGTSGAPQFISPDAAIASGLWTRIKEQIQSIRMLAGVSRGLGEYSKESRSGSAITLEADEKYTKMVSMAQSMERWENDCFEMLSRIYGGNPIEVEYQKKFDVMALENKIDSMLKLVEAGVDEKSIAVIAKTTVRELLKRSGASDDELSEATENLSVSRVQETRDPSGFPARLPEPAGVE